MVDGIGIGQNELGDGDEGVPILQQGLEDGGQSLRGVEGGVVEEHNGAGLHLGGDPLGDLPGGDVLPVQAVPVPNRFKPLGRRGCRGDGMACSLAGPGVDSGAYRGLSVTPASQISSGAEKNGYAYSQGRNIAYNDKKLDRYTIWETKQNGRDE